MCLDSQMKNEHNGSSVCHGFPILPECLPDDVCVFGCVTLSILDSGHVYVRILCYQLTLRLCKDRDAAAQSPHVCLAALA